VTTLPTTDLPTTGQSPSALPQLRGRSLGASVLPALRGEWTKLRSLRSTRWTLAALVLFTIGIGAIGAAADGSSFHTMSAADKLTWDPTNDVLVGMVFGQLAAVVIGVLTVTGEYSSGTIRSSAAAVPTRVPLVLAKSVVVGGIVLVIGEIVAFISFFLGQAILSGHAPTASLGDPGVARAVLLAGLYLPLITLMSLGLGFALRHTAGAISIMVALLLVVPSLVGLLPEGAQNALGQTMPEQIAASSMAAVVAAPHTLSPLVGTLTLVVYALIALALGTVVLRRRDV
jgi:ABC-2 type transport system permease protein